jgi:hypothetical protein
MFSAAAKIIRVVCLVQQLLPAAELSMSQLIVGAGGDVCSTRLL